MALPYGEVLCVATIEVRVDEPGLVAFAAERGWALMGFPAAALAAVAVPNPSDTVRAALGTPSVAEAAALLAAGPGGRLLVPKYPTRSVTVAIAGG